MAGHLQYSKLLVYFGGVACVYDENEDKSWNKRFSMKSGKSYYFPYLGLI